MLQSDLLHLIVAYLYYSNDGNQDNSTLLNLVRVNRQCADTILPYLWRNVDLRTPKPLFAYNMLSLFTSPRGKLLASHIHTLALAQLRGRAFEQIIELCPRVYELKVNIFESELVFPIPQLPTVRSLILTGWPTMSRVPYDLMLATPNLRHLRLDAELACPRVPTQRPAFRLYELALRRTPRDFAMAWLLPTLTELAIVELYDVPTPALRGLLLSSQLALTLRSLRVNLHNYQIAQLVRTAFRTGIEQDYQPLAQLEEYRMRMLPKIGDLASVPPCVRHLAFWNDAGDPLGMVVDLVKSSTLPNLQTLTFCPTTARRDDFPALVAACRQRGVVMHLEEFPFWNCEDPIEVAEFPRTKSLSNVQHLRHIPAPSSVS